MTWKPTPTACNLWLFEREIALKKIFGLSATAFAVVVSAGWTHGIAVTTYEGKTLKQALAKVPCNYISKDGDDLKIQGVNIVVDGKPEPSPLILSKKDEIEPVEKRCFPKHG